MCGLSLRKRAPCVIIFFILFRIGGAAEVAASWFVVAIWTSVWPRAHADKYECNSDNGKDREHGCVHIGVPYEACTFCSAEWREKILVNGDSLSGLDERDRTPLHENFSCVVRHRNMKFVRTVGKFLIKNIFPIPILVGLYGNHNRGTENINGDKTIRQSLPFEFNFIRNLFFRGSRTTFRRRRNGSNRRYREEIFLYLSALARVLICDPSLDIRVKRVIATKNFRAIRVSIAVGIQILRVCFIYKFLIIIRYAILISIQTYEWRYCFAPFRYLLHFLLNNLRGCGRTTLTKLCKFIYNMWSNSGRGRLLAHHCTTRFFQNTTLFRFNPLDIFRLYNL